MLTAQAAEPMSVDDLWKGMPEFTQEDLESWKSIKVHFATEADYRAFAALVGQNLTEKTKSIWYPAQAKTSAGQQTDDES